MHTKKLKSSGVVIYVPECFKLSSRKTAVVLAEEILILLINEKKKKPNSLKIQVLSGQPVLKLRFF